jgi:hypothetical protein
MCRASLYLSATMLGSGFRCSCLVAATAVAAVAASPAARASPTIQNCGSLARGPGGATPGTGAGARCLLRAYDDHCRPAVYVLSLFGVDTIANDRFRLARGTGGCLVQVTISARVVPQPPRQHHGICRSLARRSGHVVASRCSGDSFPKSIVLDPKPPSP